MESVLENHTFAIYSVGKNQSYGRLEIASQGMTDVLKNPFVWMIIWKRKRRLCPERCG